MTRSEGNSSDLLHSTPPMNPIESTAKLVGQQIRAARTARGWSQQGLAEKMGCTQTAVSYWEAGRRSIAVDELVELAETLGVPASSLLPGAHGGSPAGSEQTRATRDLITALNRLTDMLEVQDLGLAP
jgi:transcriptional regulator with XRE-family HTH domain